MHSDYLEPLAEIAGRPRAGIEGHGEAHLQEIRYPPDKQEKATRTVLEQAEVLCRDWAA
jgi:hypothetical protein